MQTARQSIPALVVIEAWLAPKFVPLPVKPDSADTSALVDRLLFQIYGKDPDTFAPLSTWFFPSRGDFNCLPPVLHLPIAGAGNPIQAEIIISTCAR